ncbi:sulfite exporter TauE/SafE family protein [Stutzerimonas azotifigens]|uniref:sulfite exporter TauE/SafE family protein n=1 Tax=Stutzerimonas azotifigens TaxID=291995 RepID=UPI0004209074|nr:sulfite exporter TauE/SafE family protein [Stutzerimonas azotifigens]
MDALLASPLLILFVALALFLGGAVKGTVGVGLPLVVVSLLGSLLDPRLSVALVTLPVVMTNVWQSLRSGILLGALRRFWPLILVFALSTWVGAQILVALDAALLLGLLGAAVVMFSLINLFQPRLRLAAEHERFAGPGVGLVAGLLNGVSTVNGPPLAIYLVSLGLDKETFIGSYGLIALCGSFPLLLSYIGVGLLGPTELGASLLAVVPALVGVVAGERLRHRIDPELFRRILLAVLIVLGLNLIRRAFV